MAYRIEPVHVSRPLTAEDLDALSAEGWELVAILALHDWLYYHLRADR